MTTPSAPSTLREYDISARSTDVFGRVLCSARNHHFVVDGPVQNDCPGEEVTPAEVFLSAVAACGVELIHVIARDQSASLQRVAVKIHGEVDRANQRRDDVTTFNSVRLDFTLWGVDKNQAAAVVDGFKRRCPLYGTVASVTPDVQVNFTLGT
ncbi:MAG TPA: OsmC family protein [Gemmatimonadaceae bacterium]|nr:OsmC family protein [Gemmatimonadaceae bacterium]